MARRKPPPATTAAGAVVPEWVLSFEAADWSSTDDVAPQDFGHPPWMYFEIRQRDRWAAAAKAWLAKHGGREKEFFRLTQDYARSRMVPLGAGRGAT
ncbi:hypothetical protein [Actinoplanes sp. NPDC051859]|uniref:hypothetical protein n=1 Tax=Actinoplanes sp. NPDC051859 TaxID=3363909 RepID=UPI0037A36639